MLAMEDGIAPSNRGEEVLTPGQVFKLFDRSQIKRALNVESDRTIIRYERAGMPFIAVGNLRLYDPIKVKAWLLTHERRHEVPRRGRPNKRTAA